MLPKRCGICKRLLGLAADPTTLDCGGDCLRCMAEAGDPDCEAEMQKIKKAMPLLYDVTSRNGMAQKGHLSTRTPGPFFIQRAKDEPGRIEEVIRKRLRAGNTTRKRKDPEPVTLNWKAPKSR